ncbi:MAG: hypothetical protein QOJ35_3922 [Solirubrobacteraceae bacterium]|jgi:6-phosphogluconolactonase (cycloisomerase 2 family)|nr:hypothetical protein [Solirubrobacteraceae bacterium]
MARAGMIGRICLPAVTVAAVLAALPAVAGAASAQPRAVYTQTNQPTGNAVVWFARSADGRLTQRRSFPTGGRGAPNYHSHFPITDSQGSVVVNPQKTLLFAVNHGSRSVTSFRILRDGGLRRVQVASSGGKGPASLAINKDGLLYVVNEAPPASLQGFRVTADGRMLPTSRSARVLAHPESSPGQVGFDASGRFLVVSDRFVGASGVGQDDFEIFRPSREGVLRAVRQLISIPQEPYAFAFTSRNEMLVANANNNAPLASTTSSYRLDPGGRFTRVAAQPTSQTAGCWIAISGDDRFAFVSNGGAPTVVAYAISPGGGFRNLSPGLITVSGLGGDVALSSGSAFLYVLNTDPSGILAMDPKAHADVDAFRVGNDGATTRIGTFGMGRLPFTSSGLAAL